MNYTKEELKIYYAGFEAGVKFSTDFFNTVVAKNMLELLDTFKKFEG